MATGQRSEEAIFNDARKIESADRRAEFLQEACGDDRRLRARIEALLRVHEKDAEFLESPPSGVDPTLEQSPIAEGPGAAIGPYKLLQQIGEGGFGVVYMAEQEHPVRRKVALKIIKPGMDTKEVIARFEAEEQALAMMDHPNIAHVLDAGTTESGRPYFVMELVKGIPITDYCDKYNLTPRERLDLFTSVCHAVQHAHQKGIIHRDIKPSNVLVTLHDGEPVVKVIDFGVAKAINQRLTERTLFTKFAQLVGTPMYMSPEQAELSGLDVDTRTDVYSLGVLLYELLTGTTPFDKKRIREAAYDEIRRIIREEEPRKPSTQISTLGDTASEISAHRKTEPKKLSALLRGDLDWIVMKALEKDRRRRYSTAKDFAADVMRYTNDEPVEASPPSLVYRMRKFVRRNRAPLGVGTVVAVLLVSLAAVIVTTAFARIDARAKVAEVRATRAELDIAQRDKAAAEENERIAQQERERADRKARDLEWLRNTALPQLQKLKDDKNWIDAFLLAEEARAKFPDDVSVLQFWQEVSSTWSVATDPPGAKVSVRPYDDRDQAWAMLGTTPLNRIAAAQGFYHWKIEKDGYELIEGCAGPEVVDLKIALDVKDTRPGGMVRVAASMREGEAEFFIDRYEVTNRQFKWFVDAGSYSEPKYWQHRFVDEEGKPLSPKEAMARFVDRTGKPGPSTWKDGTYPPGEDDRPVRGISWYEAAAYAARVQKSLPTIYDWQLASGRDYEANIVPASNVGTAGPVPVGQRPGVGPFGTYDMAGNVREWCWNEGDARQRYILGGAWNEPEYMFTAIVAQPPMDRSETNGFRCVLYGSPPSEQLLAPLIPEFRDYSREKPVSDQEFEAIRRAYAYEPKPLNAKVTVADETEAYRHEIATFDAAYGNERVTLHMFLPRRGKPPFQTVVYFGGADGTRSTAFYDRAYSRCNAAFLVETGRAVVWPIYKGTFDRGGGHKLATLNDYKQQTIHQSHDLRATVDYLCERDDIDRDRLAYFGSSMGASKGPLLLALEDRIKTGVLLVGGLDKAKRKPPPELDAFNFAPRVAMPILMINGRTDDIFPYEISQVPLFKALGTEDKDKSHRVFLGGHAVPREHTVNETLAWLDRYLGSPSSDSTAEGEIGPVAAAKREADTGNLFLSWKKYAEAEKRFRKALEFGQPIWGAEHQETLKLTSRLATAIEKQGRNDEAIELFERTLELQRKAIGPDHEDVRETTKALCGLRNEIVWTICSAADKPREDYDRAAQLARKTIATDPANGSRWLLSYAHFRRGDTEASLDALAKSFANENEDWIGRWFLASMVHHMADDRELARDWYTATCEWVRKTDNRWSPVRHLGREASSLLNLPTEWPPADWSREQHVQTYDRLIDAQPGIARLFYCRGSHYGRLGQWQNAAADYRKAADLDPKSHRYREAETAIVACTGTQEELQATCNRFSEECRNLTPHARTDMVLLCSLIPDSNLDAGDLDRIIDEVLNGVNVQPYHELAKGMVLYRLGRYEEALAVLPNPSLELNNPKDAILPVFFRAMAHHQLGDAYTCRKLLEEARKASKEQIESPEGPFLPYQDRPVVWCMIQIALREAEALIEPSSDAPDLVTKSDSDL